jgi:adenylylsulfate kinase
MEEPTNITWHNPTVTKADRARKQGYRPCILWLTGLPSSGKSTLAHELEARLFAKGCHTYVLDGDNIRHGLNKDLGFSPEDRSENIRRIGEVAKLMVDAGLVVITAFISPYIADRQMVRNLVSDGEFIEVYVKCSLEECKRRDPKGLYAKAQKGEITGFTGISAPYEKPVSPEIMIDTEKSSLDECVQQVINYLSESKLAKLED